MFEVKEHIKTSGKESRAGASFFRPKLIINQPDDVYEQEADAMAEQVMRMPANENAFFKPSIPFIQRKCASCEQEEKKQLQTKSEPNVIQKQEPSGSTSSTDVDLSLRSSFDLASSSSGPDYLGLRQPFFNRNVPHLWDPNSAVHVWQYNFDFFRRFGLSASLSISLSNLTAPMFIDSQLKFNNPTWWEITDRELNTTTRSLSIPVLELGPNFSPSRPGWFRTLFGGGNSVQRKCETCEAETTVQRKETEDYINTIC